MNIALIGPSGSGKGTHARGLEEQFGLRPLVTGELFRENAKNHTALWFMAKRYLSQGELVPDEVVDAMVAEWLYKADPDHGVLFDGFPRTIYQSQFLDEHLKEIGRHLDAVIYLKIPDEMINERLEHRVICDDCHRPFHLKFDPPKQEGVCDNCNGNLSPRAEDIPAMIRVRLRAFRQVIRPILDYYQETGRLIIIDGAGTIEQVDRDIVEAVKTVQRKESRGATREETEHMKTVLIESIPSIKSKTDDSYNVVFVGGPGSGKGTQAELLKDALGLVHLATGDLFREHLKLHTDLGQLAKTYMDRGELVPDDVTEAMVEERISRPDMNAGFILDGFPRTLPQAQALTEMMNHIHKRISKVLYIKVSDDKIIGRLSGRLLCRDCQELYHREFKPSLQPGVCDVCGGELYQRDDDNPKTVLTRLKTFHAQTAPLINYYKNEGILVGIDGEQDSPTVSQLIRQALGR